MSFFPAFMPNAQGQSTPPVIRPKYILFKTNDAVVGNARTAFTLNSKGSVINMTPSGLDTPWASDYAVIPWVNSTQRIDRSTSSLTQTQNGYVNEKRLTGGGFQTGTWVISGEIAPIPYSLDHIAEMALKNGVVDELSNTPWIFQILSQAMRLMEECEEDPHARLVLYSLQEGEYWYVQPLNRSFLRRMPNRVGWHYDFYFNLLARAEPPNLNIVITPITENKSWWDKMMSAVNKGIKYAAAGVAWANAVVKKVGQYANQIKAALQNCLDAFESITTMLNTIMNYPENLTLWASGWAKSWQSAALSVRDSWNEMVSFFENYVDYWQSSSNEGPDDPETGDTSPSENSRLIAEMQPIVDGLLESVDDAVVGLRMGLSETIKGKTSRTISEGDTLEAIAVEVYGDDSYAAQIATWNNLIPPYISNSGIPGTAKPGDTIYLPYTIKGSSGTLAPIDGTFAGDIEEAMYGRGVKLIMTPGNPLKGDIEVANDRKGVNEVFGSDCVHQGLQVRMSTTQGSDRTYPYLGIPAAIGQVTDPTAQAMMNAAVGWQIRADNRVKAVKNLDIFDDSETLGVEATIQLVSTSEPIGVSV